MEQTLEEILSELVEIYLRHAGQAQVTIDQLMLDQKAPIRTLTQWLIRVGVQPDRVDDIDLEWT